MPQESNHRPERRALPRRKCSGLCEILAHGRRFGWGTVTDISRGGCYVETEQLLPIGSDVQLRLNIANMSLEISAWVATNHPLVGMGFQFLPIPESKQSEFTVMLAQVVAMTALA